MSLRLSYAFAPHVEAIAASISHGSQAESNLFALLDGARETAGIQRVLKTLPILPTALVFDDSFARSALHLSPRLQQLSEDPGTRLLQMRTLDRACCELPMLAFLRSGSTLTELASRLRKLLLIEADGSPYLLRFADTQMLPAVSSVLTPAQRSAFFDGIHAWLTVDFESSLHDAADRALYAHDVPAATVPLQFDAAQTDALLAAVVAPVLVGQMNVFDAAFASSLTHAQQSAFAAKCIAAHADAASDEGELVSLALQQWRNESVPHEVTQ